MAVVRVQSAHTSGTTQGSCASYRLTWLLTEVEPPLGVFGMSPPHSTLFAGTEIGVGHHAMHVYLPLIDRLMGCRLVPSDDVHTLLTILNGEHRPTTFGLQ